MPCTWIFLPGGWSSNAGTVSGKITATETEEDNKVSGEVTVTYNPQMKGTQKMEITENYSDDFFSTDNSKYNQELAEFSLLVTMASQSKWTADRSDRDAYIRLLFVDKLKFTEYFSKKYDVTLDNTDNTVGYAFARKKIDGKNVMAIAIRSGGYGGEWESNGRICGGAIDGEHDGFGSAAKAVFSDVAEICQRKPDRQDLGSADTAEAQRYQGFLAAGYPKAVLCRRQTCTAIHSRRLNRLPR